MYHPLKLVSAQQMLHLQQKTTRSAWSQRPGYLLNLQRFGRLSHSVAGLRMSLCQILSEVVTRW